MAFGVAEVFAYGRARVRRKKLHRRRVRGGRLDDDGIVHRAEILQGLDDLRDRRSLLPDRNVDADHVLPFLVDDRIDRDRRLTRLAVADNQLALSATDGHHRVNRLESGLQRLFYGLAINDAGRDAFNRIVIIRNDQATVVNRIAERVYNAPDQGVADRHLHDAPRALDQIALPDLLKVAEEHRADFVFFKVQSEAAHVVWKFQ